jgi:DNA polymerase-1
MPETFKTLIIDSSYLAYRSYFALADAEAEQHMVQSFIRSLWTTVSRFEIQQVILAWDGGHVYKSRLYEGYRQKVDILTPSQRQDFKSQFSLLKEILSGIGLKSCMQNGVEADDVIAFLCRNKHIPTEIGEGYEVQYPILILSSDHDLYPLLSKDVAILKGKGIPYTEDSFREEFSGLSPDKYHIMQSLMGCSSDKVPGVKGVGVKHAIKLISRYGSLEELRSAPRVDRIISLVQDNWESVELSYKLAIFQEVSPVLEIGVKDLPRVRRLLYKYQLYMLLDNWNNIVKLSVL